MKKILILSMLMLISYGGYCQYVSTITSGNCYKVDFSGTSANGTIMTPNTGGVGIAAANNTDNQLWKFTLVGGSTYTIQNMSTNTYLTKPTSGNLSLSSTSSSIAINVTTGTTNASFSISNVAISGANVVVNPYGSNFFILTSANCPTATPTPTPTPTTVGWQVGAGTNNIINSNTGAVLIGTGLTATSIVPGYKLYVSDGVLMEKAVIAIKNTSNWSDFVFEKKYKLRSLQEVESYIINNKHLPEIPSAEEIVATGLNVADTQAKLLQKIEELTLYLIEQSKITKKQEDRLRLLERNK